MVVRASYTIRILSEKTASFPQYERQATLELRRAGNPAASQGMLGITSNDPLNEAPLQGERPLPQKIPPRTPMTKRGDGQGTARAGG